MYDIVCIGDKCTIIKHTHLTVFSSITIYLCNVLMIPKSNNTICKPRHTMERHLKRALSVNLQIFICSFEYVCICYRQDYYNTKSIKLLVFTCDQIYTMETFLPFTYLNLHNSL